MKIQAKTLKVPSAILLFAYGCIVTSTVSALTMAGWGFAQVL
jgi:hypothetical protein